MQGVQGIRSGRTRQAAYDGYSILGRCPECREDLVCAGEGELACSYCGIVVGRAESAREEGSSAPSGSKSEPLGSYIVADTESAPSLTGSAFGWAKLMPNVVGRGGPSTACSGLTNRVADRLGLPKSVAQNAQITARKLLPHREAYGTTVATISAYSILHACRSAGMTHVSHREVLKAYTDAGYRVGKSELLQLGLESGMPLPHPTAEDFVRAAIAKLRSNERVAERLRQANLDPKAYFTRLYELAKEVAAEPIEPNGFSPRTVAAGSVYVASLSMPARTLSQKDAGEALGMAEYTVRDFCFRRRSERGIRERGGRHLTAEKTQAEQGGE
jgi:transcription initiation factor TFIIIB Brf1 subunit/transcription initiation factor TFIIB